MSSTICLCSAYDAVRYFVDPGHGARSSVGGLSVFGTEASIQTGDGGAPHDEELTERGNMDASNNTTGSLHNQQERAPMTKKRQETIPECHDYGSDLSFDDEAIAAKKPERRFAPARLVTSWGVNLAFTDEYDV
jgi:hypothetical protein